MGTSQTSALSCFERLLLPRLEFGRAVAQDWPQIYTNGDIWRVWRKNATLFPSSDWDCSSGSSSYCATQLFRTQVPNSRTRRIAEPAQVLLQLQRGELHSRTWVSVRSPPSASTKQSPPHTPGPSVRGTGSLKG